MTLKDNTRLLDLILDFKTRLHMVTGVENPVVTIEVSPQMWMRLVSEAWTNYEPLQPVGFHGEKEFKMFGIKIRKADPSIK